MKLTHIQHIIDDTIPRQYFDIYKTEIQICPINQQVEQINITIFDPAGSAYIPLRYAGEIMDKLVDYTMGDGYGDLTIIDFQYNTFHELPDNPDHMGILWAFKTNIDS